MPVPTILTIVIFWLTGLFASVSVAEPLAGDVTWREARADYSKAVSALRRNDMSQFEHLERELIASEYPLASYLTYLKYRRQIDKTPVEQILAFISTHQDSPISEQLRQFWLVNLAKDHQWSRFALVYDEASDATRAELTCYYAQALLNLGKTEQAFETGKTLYKVGRSQHRACDPVFKTMQSAGVITDVLIWQRLELAMESNHLKLAQYLARQLQDATLRSDAALWHKLYLNPESLAQTTSEFQDIARHRVIVLHTLTRLVRTDKEKTLAFYDILDQGFHFTQAERDRFVSYIARYISFTFNPRSYELLLQVDQLNQDQKVQDKRLEVAIRANNWPAVLLWASQEPSSAHEASRYHYWQARATNALALAQSRRLLLMKWPSVNPNSVLYIHRLMRAALSTDLGAEYLALRDNYQPMAAWQHSQAILQELAKERNYYGFIASQQLDKPVSLNHASLVETPEQLTAVAQTPALQRARELYVLKQKSAAYREWVKSLKTLNDSERGAAAHLAKLWGWDYQAIFTAARSAEYDNIELRFPRHHAKAVDYQATSNGIAPDWVFAVIRQESAFRADAQSHVGAMGLMQLMPATARHVSKNLGLGQPRTQQLLTPDFNILLGSAYLRELYHQFDQNIVMATAAYNAGPHRVLEWQPDLQAIAGDIWIDTIPFKETREYVKNIVTYQVIYRHHLGEQAHITADARLIHAKVPSKSLQLPTQLVDRRQ